MPRADRADEWRRHVETSRARRLQTVALSDADLDEVRAATAPVARSKPASTPPPTKSPTKPPPLGPARTANRDAAGAGRGASSPARRSSSRRSTSR